MNWPKINQEFSVMRHIKSILSQWQDKNDIKTKNLGWGLVLHTFNSSVQEAEVEDLVSSRLVWSAQWVADQQAHTVRSYLKKEKETSIVALNEDQVCGRSFVINPLLSSVFAHCLCFKLLTVGWIRLIVIVKGHFSDLFSRGLTYLHLLHYLDYKLTFKILCV